MAWVGTAMYAAFAVTGFGYSLVYPGFGVEAVRHAPPQSRGLAMEPTPPFSIWRWDSPTLRWVWSSGAGLGAVFLVSMLVVFCAAAIALPLLNVPSLEMASRSQNYE